MFSKNELFSRTPELKDVQLEMARALEYLKDAALSGCKVLCCGNGGSCADSEHIAGELMKGFLKKRPLDREERLLWQNTFGEEGVHEAECLQNGIPCVVLSSQTALLTAVLNDNDPSMAFAQAAWVTAKEGDVFIGLSTSGNSENVLAAARAAKLRGAKIIAMTGQRKSKLSELADAAIRVPATETYRVQEYHIQVYHWLCAALEDALYEE